MYLPSLIMDCTAMAFSPKTTSLFKLRIIGIKKKRQTTSPATVLLLLLVTTDRTNFVALFANLGFISVLTSDIFALPVGSSPEEKETKASGKSVQSVYVNSEFRATPSVRLSGITVNEIQELKDRRVPENWGKYFEHTSMFQGRVRIYD